MGTPLLQPRVTSHAHHALSLRQGVTTFLLVLNSQAIYAMYMLICALCRCAGHTKFTVALIISAGLQTGLFNIFGGIFIAPRDVPAYWQWISYSCPTYYAYSAILRVNLEGFSLMGACDEVFRLIDKSGE